MILIDLCGNIRLYSILFFITLPLPPNSILFPYTTLFRSRMFENYQGPFYVFIGINRNQEAIENVSFDLSLLDRKSTRLNSSHVAISYAVFCLKKKRKQSHTLNSV